MAVITEKAEITEKMKMTGTAEMAEVTEQKEMEVKAEMAKKNEMAEKMDMAEKKERKSSGKGKRKRVADFMLQNVMLGEAGEGFIDVLVKMLIVVVVGAVLMAIMRTAVPQLFTDMLTKVRGIFEV